MYKKHIDNGGVPSVTSFNYFNNLIKGKIEDNNECQLLSSFFSINIINNKDIKIVTTINSSSVGVVLLLCNINNELIVKKSFRIYNRKIPKLFIKELYYTSMFNHPNIIKIKGISYYDNINYSICYEKHGTDIYKYRGNLDKNVLLDVCKAIKLLHDNNILHGDIKPENILYEDGVIKLIDFSYSEDLSLNKPVSKKHKYSPLFTPPEIIYSDKKSIYISLKSDIWALGITLYELYTGRDMFDYNTIDGIKRGLIFDVYNIINDISDEKFKDLISNMCCFNNRYSIDDVINHKFFLLNII